MVMRLVVLSAFVLWVGGVSFGAAPEDYVTPKVHDAVNKALSYLKRTQNPDGSWGSDSYGRHPAISALACMAMMAQGNLPARGRYGSNVERGIKFLMKCVDQKTGYIGGEGGEGQMYGHGFATLALAEAYGMMPSDELRKQLHLAIKCILQSQKSDGGWRYDPNPYGESDLSLTICQVMALRAANNAGIKITKATIARAVKYTKQSANADGGFRYVLQSSGSSFALTGAGVTTLYGAGEYDTKEAKNGLEYLKKYLEQYSGQGHYGNYFYGHYYAAQAMYQAGGKYWDFYYPKMRDELLRTQEPSGCWHSEVGDVFGAAMGALVLEVPYNYLPIFQR